MQSCAAVKHGQTAATPVPFAVGGTLISLLQQTRQLLSSALSDVSMSRPKKRTFSARKTNVWLLPLIASQIAEFQVISDYKMDKRKIGCKSGRVWCHGSALGDGFVHHPDQSWDGVACHKSLP
jgi:hypothetical protein